MTGLKIIACNFSVREITDRMEEIIKSKGLIVFARIDHGGGAAAAGLPLRPTELIIFGHPRGGTPLMQDRQTAGIDLPVKILAWEDENKRVWLTYNESAWLKERHGLSDKSDPTLQAIEDGIEAICRAALTADK